MPQYVILTYIGEFSFQVNSVLVFLKNISPALIWDLRCFKEIKGQVEKELNTFKSKNHKKIW